jgi:transposase
MQSFAVSFGQPNLGFRIGQQDVRLLPHPADPRHRPSVATAIVAAIGNGAAFRKGRDFAAWLGLVPRRYSTGGKTNLLGISKRGNIYLSKILIHGARAAAMRIKRDRFAIGGWMNALEARAPRNVLVVAMANKLARIAWAVLSTGEDYRPGVIVAAA